MVSFLNTTVPRLYATVGEMGQDEFYKKSPKQTENRQSFFKLCWIESYEGAFIVAPGM